MNPHGEGLLGPELWAGPVAGGLMKSVACQKPLVISEHRNSTATRGSRAARTPVGSGGVRRPAGPCVLLQALGSSHGSSVKRSVRTPCRQVGWCG